jgi:hypothetical protein
MRIGYLIKNVLVNNWECVQFKPEILGLLQSAIYSNAGEADIMVIVVRIEIYIYLYRRANSSVSCSSVKKSLSPNSCASSTRCIKLDLKLSYSHEAGVNDTAISFTTLLFSQNDSRLSGIASPLLNVLIKIPHVYEKYIYISLRTTNLIWIRY